MQSEEIAHICAVRNQRLADEKAKKQKAVDRALKAAEKIEKQLLKLKKQVVEV
jgi:hypothetical protein